MLNGTGTPRDTSGSVLSYGIAVLAIVLATLLRLWFAAALGAGVPFLFYFPAVALSAWHGGLGPGLCAAGTGTLAAWYLLVPPYNSFRVESVQHWLQLAAFLLAASFISLLIEKLQRSQRRFRVTLSSIGDGVIVTDAAGRVTLINTAAQALTGWTEEAIGRPLADVFHIVNEHTRAPVVSPVKVVLERGTVVGLANHTLLVHRDGSERPIDDSGAPVRDRTGNIVGVVMVFRDVSERRRSEGALARTAAIVESSDDAIIGKSLEGVITHWNAAAERLFGYSAEAAKGRNVTMLIPAEQLAEEATILATIRQGERVHHYETVRLARDGRRVPVSLSVSPIKNARGEVTGCATILRDMTERDHASERFRLAVEAAPNGMVMVDDAGRILVANAHAEKLFGHGRGELVGRSIESLVPERFRGAHADYRRQFAAAPGARPMGAGRDLYGLRQDGTEVPVEIGLNPIELDGRMMVLSSIVDISERRQREQERAQLLEREQRARARAEEASRLKDEFLATVSHELRAPLNAMLGWATLLRAGKLDAERTHAAIETIERNAKAQARIIDDLLDVSRIITGKLRLDVHPLMVASVVESALTSVRPMAEAKDIRLQASLDPNAGPVSGDANRLQQVVWNLLTNAIKFTPRGGRVQVRVERINSHVEIIVSDTGQGIGSRFLAHVFDRFRQEDGETTRHHGGLGLGLAIVRHLVELHGGTVRVDSPGEGKGATFTVRLPLMIWHARADDEERVHPRVDRHEPLPLAALPNLGGIRVLVVDDEIESSSVLRSLLEQCGAEVRDAQSAAQALHAAQEWRPALIVSDIGMPGEDGYTFMERYRAWEQTIGGWTPAVALTAYARGEDRVRALSAGYQTHVAKPVDLVEFALIVAGLLQRGRHDG